MRSSTFSPMPGRMSAGAAVLLVLWLCAAAPTAEPQAPERADTERLEADEQREMDHLLDDLKDGKRDLPLRRRAATVLMDRGWPAAGREVRRLLLYGNDPILQRAIAQGVAETQRPDPRLVGALAGLLGSDDPALRGDVGAALGRFDDPALVRQLADAALDRGAALSYRLGATAALGQHRDRSAAGALIDLVIRTDDDLPVRKAGFESLSQLTGLRGLGADLNAWQRWWERARKLDDRDWTRDLMRHMASRNAELGKQVAELAARLTDAYVQVHDAANDEGRAAIVQRMLGDDLTEVRLKALVLVEQRVLNGQSQKIGDTTRAALRERLNDSTPAVRAKAAIVLEGLADAQGAALAADLLPVERDASVQAACLRLLARVPNVTAVSEALRLLDTPDLRTPAAAFLIAALDKELLNASERDAALQSTRVFISVGQPVNATTLQLLGRLGREEDQVLVLPHLRGGEPPLRTAAVEAFANERWPIAPLLDYLDDPALRPTVWKLIGKRGRTAQVLTKLLDHEPSEAERLSEWQAVVAAVAGRLSMDDLVKIDDALRAQPHRRKVHETVLLASAGLGADGAPAQGASVSEGESRADAELLLGEFYLRQREPGKAKAVYGRLASRPALSPEQRRRIDLGILERMLQQESLEEAAAHTVAMLGATSSPPIPRMASCWLDASERALAARNLDLATALVGRVEELFKEKLDPKSQSRLAELKKKIPIPRAVAPAQP